MRTVLKRNRGFSTSIGKIKNILTEQFLFKGLLSMTLLIDCANGLFSDLPIGSFFRIIILLFAAIIIIKYDRKSFSLCLLIFSFLTINNIRSFLCNCGEGISYDISIGVKSALFFVIYTALLVLNKKGKINIEDIRSVFFTNMLYGPLLFLVSSIAGVGRSSYYFGGQIVGSKGLFLSLNSINIALVVLYVFSISELFKNKINFLWGVVSVYIAIPLLMLGTKTSIIMIFLIPLLFAFLYIRKKGTWYVVIFSFVGITVLFLLFKEKIANKLSGIIERQKFLFGMRSFSTYLFSTRNLRLKRVIDYYLSSFSVWDIFPGRGYYQFHKMVAVMENSIGAIPIEMDWADLITAYGVTGLLYTYLPAIVVLIKNHRIAKYGIGKPFFWSAVILLLYGSLAGHLFMEAISSSFFALILAGCKIIGKNENI